MKSFVCTACGGSLYVGDEAVIEAPFQENCKWQIQTDEKHVLAFSLVHGGNFEEVLEFFSVINKFEYFPNCNFYIFLTNKLYFYLICIDSWWNRCNWIEKSNPSRGWSHKRWINHHILHHQCGSGSTIQEDAHFNSEAQNSKGIIKKKMYYYSIISIWQLFPFRFSINTQRRFIVPLIWDQRANVAESSMKLPATVQHSQKYVSKYWFFSSHFVALMFFQI